MLLRHLCGNKGRNNRLWHFLIRIKLKLVKKLLVSLQPVNDYKYILYKFIYNLHIYTYIYLFAYIKKNIYIQILIYMYICIYIYFILFIYNIEN